jgi:hypothetical protein
MKRIVPFSRDDANFRYALKHWQESALAFHGEVTCDHFRKGHLIHTQTGKNTFTTEGLAYLLNVMFYSTGKAAALGFYVGIFHTSAYPAVGDTAATALGAGGSYGESQDADYTPATNKPQYTAASTSTVTCTNSGAPAVFTIVPISVTIYGAFLSNVADKTAVNGKLMCAKRFGTARAVTTADVLSVTYAITCTTG